MHIISFEVLHKRPHISFDILIVFKKSCYKKQFKQNPALNLTNRNISAPIFAFR